MSEIDPFAQINADNRQRIILALGELTLSNISNGARADHFQAAYGGMENTLAAVQGEIEKLKAEITKAGAIPDLRAVDFDTLCLELKHRGFFVSAEPATLEEASPVPQDFALPERDAAVHDDSIAVAFGRRAPGVGD